jgi:hypothetical protein
LVQLEASALWTDWSIAAGRVNALRHINAAMASEPPIA